VAGRHRAGSRQGSGGCGPAGTAAEAAPSETLTIEEDDTLEEAARLLAERDASHLLVLRHDCPVGVICDLDIATMIRPASG
jgi:predicted transcriptional regulator